MKPADKKNPPHTRARQRARTLIFACATLLGACHKPQSPPVPTPEVTVVRIAPADTPVTYEFVGTTASSQQVEVRARVNGFLDQRLYTEGGMVKQGQPMFQMDRKPFQAQLDAARAALAQERAKLATDQANLKRVEPLAKANAVSKKELDDARGRVNTAAAAVEMATANVDTANLNLGYTTIYAPVTGASSFARIQTGAYVNEQSGALTYVAQLDPVWVDFSISEDDMLRFRQQKASGQLVAPERGEMSVAIVLADGSLYPHTGKIFFADANYSTETGTFLIRATFDNPDGDLRPGQFVRVRLGGVVRPNAILVPQTAVIQGAQGAFVWILDDQDKAQIRNVEVGNWVADDWLILSGLSAGDRVVVDGTLRLAPGISVKLVPAAAGAGGQDTASRP